MSARFPSGSVREAVARHGDEWLWNVPAQRAARYPEVLASEVDQHIFGSSEARRRRLRAEAGARARLPRRMRPR
jgi:hypothetical protein